jgi:Ca2+-binding RTX toxin-like protein
MLTKLDADLHALNPAFFKAAAAADANDYIVYNHATGALFYDSNGNGVGGAIQIAALINKPVLTASDFVVI